MRANRWLATALLGLLLLAGCRTEDPAIAEVTTPSGETVIISQQEFLDYLRYRTSGQPLTQDQIPTAANELFNQLVAERLGVAEAHAQGIGVEGERIDDLLAARAGGKAYATLSKYAQQNDLENVETLRGFLLADATLTKLFAKTNSDGKNLAHVRMIVFSEGFVPGATPEQQAPASEENRLRAEQTYQELQQGADFAQLARTRSNHEPTAAEGGDIGVISADEPGLPPEVLPVFDLPDNGFTAPVLIEGFGWCLFQRLPLTLDAMAERMSQVLESQNADPQLQQQRADWVRSFYDQANLEGRIRVFADPVQVAQEDLAQNPQQ